MHPIKFNQLSLFVSLIITASHQSKNPIQQPRMSQNLSRSDPANFAQSLTLLLDNSRANVKYLFRPVTVDKWNQHKMCNAIILN